MSHLSTVRKTGESVADVENLDDLLVNIANGTISLTIADPGALYDRTDERNFRRSLVAYVLDLRAKHNVLVASYNDLLAKARTAGLIEN